MSNTSKRRWTNEEKDILIRTIQQYPDNISHAFEKASELLEGRTPSACNFQYYSKLKHSENNIITTGSKKGFTKNVKNTVRVEGVFPEDRVLNPILWVMRQFLDLSKKDRELFLQFCNSTNSTNKTSYAKEVRR